MPRVLIADDISFVRKSLKQILTSLGYEVVGEAENGREAVELYELVHPDLVTMDLAMPELNGVEATKRILKLDPAANVVILSSLTQEAWITDAISAGAKNYIMKPFQTADVARVLKEVTSSSGGNLNQAYA